MVADDRRGDWEHGVDENLASLNTGQRVMEDLIEDLETKNDAFDRLIRGDTERETSGLIGRLEAMEHHVGELRAIIIMDATGKHGLQHEVQLLMSGERNSGERWKFATAVTVAIISLLGLLITNWDRIEAFLNHKAKDPIEQLAHPKSKHRRAVPKQEETEDVD